MREDILRERRKKLEAYESKTSPFPAKTGDLDSVASSLADFSGKKRVAGRIFSLRDQGKILFADIRDETGKIQIVADGEVTKEFSFIQGTLDMGDIIAVEGEPFVTKRGEKSLKAERVTLLAKAMRPLPDSWYGIEDTELRLRKRYLDFLMNEEATELVRKKSVFWDSIRGFLKKEGFLEVETPVLEPIPGGAEAAPFSTHMNALDQDFYLRISLELSLKKMLVGGFERVFEIGRIFRNEGIDREHLQDYTQMECYAAYKDYEWMMEKMQRMYQETVSAVFGSEKTRFQGQEIDWGGKWPKVDYFEIFKKEAGMDLANVSVDELRKKAEELGLSPEPFAGEGRLIDLIFKKTARPKLIQPCFLVNPPVSIEPLAKRMEEDPSRVYRFQIMACGTEIGKGFSELNDPRDQRARFEEQMRLREGGDNEAQMIDESFIESLEYGMPPAAGFGVSERLFSVFADKPIRETVAFPLMRKEK